MDDGLIEPREGECVLCFVRRGLGECGCDSTLRWTVRFGEVRVPEATSLRPRMERVGGSCDCAIFRHGYRLRRALCERDVHDDELREPSAPPPCEEVRRTSARPCGNWVRHHAWDREPGW